MQFTVTGEVRREQLASHSRFPLAKHGIQMRQCQTWDEHFLCIKHDSANWLIRGSCGHECSNNQWISRTGYSNRDCESARSKIRQTAIIRAAPLARVVRTLKTFGMQVQDQCEIVCKCRWLIRSPALVHLSAHRRAWRARPEPRDPFRPGLPDRSEK